MLQRMAEEREDPIYQMMEKLMDSPLKRLVREVNIHSEVVPVIQATYQEAWRIETGIVAEVKMQRFVIAITNWVSKIASTSDQHTQLPRTHERDRSILRTNKRRPKHPFSIWNHSSNPEITELRNVSADRSKFMILAFLVDVNSSSKMPIPQ